MADTLDPDTIIAYGETLKRRKEEAREKALNQAYQRLESKSPREMMLDDTPLVLADLHRRLTAVERE